MVLLNNAKIYKIISDKTNKIYIGSTIQDYLSKRLGGHRKDFKKWQETNKNYCSSFDILKLGDYKIILLEAYPCESRDELNKREREYIEKYKNKCVNIDCPYFSREEVEEQFKKRREKAREKARLKKIEKLKI